MISYKTLAQKNFYEIFPKDHKQFEKIRQDLVDRIEYAEHIFENVVNLTCVFAFDGDKIVGISKFGKYGFNADYWALAFISIDKDYRGKGISKELIKHTVKFLKKNNIKEFSLSSLEPEGKSAKIAENFYVECKKNGIELHLSYMDKELENKLKSIAKMIRKMANNNTQKIASSSETEVERLLKILLPGTIFANKVHAVGGYNRDSILGIESKDLDIVVEMENGAEKLTKFISDMFYPSVTKPHQMGAGYPIWQITFKEDIVHDGVEYKTKGAIIEFADTMKESSK